MYKPRPRSRSWGKLKLFSRNNSVNRGGKGLFWKSIVYSSSCIIPDHIINYLVIVVKKHRDWEEFGFMEINKFILCKVLLNFSSLIYKVKNFSIASRYFFNILCFWEMLCFTTTSCSVFVKRKVVIGCKNELRFAIYLLRSQDLCCDFFWYLYTEEVACPPTGGQTCSRKED